MTENLETKKSKFPFATHLKQWKDMIFGDSSHLLTSEMTWAVAFLVFLFYFMFQAMFFAQGYQPFRETAYVTYTYRSLLAAFLFWGLLLWMLPKRLRSTVSGIALLLFFAASTMYFGVIVSARPNLVPFNDRAEALSLAISNMLAGHFPYLPRTHLGGPITPLTTSFLLAFPTQVLFKRPELTTIALLGIVFIALAWQRSRTRSPLPLSILAMLLFLNPSVIWELIWGSDLIWGSILLALAAIFLDALYIRTAAVFFAAALCTRTAFFLLVPLWGLFMYRHCRSAFTRALLIVAGVVIVLELPMILWNPDVFFHVAPLGVSSQKLTLPFPTGDNAIADFANLILPAGSTRSLIVLALMFILSGILGCKTKTKTQLLLHTAILFCVMLFFMGKLFLLDYLVWVVLPLITLLAGYSNKSHKIKT